MYIEEELLDYLSEQMSERGGNKVRNRELISYFYGFGDMPWPTYEQVAENFGMTKQRAEQIIREKFLANLAIHKLPTVLHAANLIESYDFISSENLLDKLIQQGFGDSTLNVKGLLNLLNDIGRCKNYAFYGSDLQKVGRSSVNSRNTGYLIRSDALPHLKKNLNKARTFPGLLGLAKLTELRTHIGGDAQEYFSKIDELISSSNGYCEVEVEGEKWFTLEERDNTLINSCEKLFGVIDACEIATLSEVLVNSLHRRSSKYSYPSAVVMEAFFRKSRHFKIHDSSIRFEGEKSNLTDIEADVVNYLKDIGKSNYPALKKHLTTLGYGSPAIVKVANNSPLVFVDKRNGRTRHTYQLVPQLIVAMPVTQDVDERDAGFRERLLKLGALGTDVSITSTRRREQGIFKEKLFADLTTAVCAICGQVYSVGALVAAHKKKRANCTEQERVDLNIVMPLCVFGCDYLYEERIITINDGIVCAGNISQADSVDKRRALELVGIKIEDRWLVGDPSYFQAS